jgi:hypothetical protein
MQKNLGWVINKYVLLTQKFQLNIPSSKTIGW